MRQSFVLRSFFVLMGMGWVSSDASGQEGPRVVAAGTGLESLRATQQQLEYAREAREGQRWQEGVRKRQYDADALAQASLEQQRAREQWEEEESRRFSEEHRFRAVTQTLPEADARARREAMREEARLRIEAAAQRRAQEEMGHVPADSSHGPMEGDGELPPIPAPELPPRGMPPIPLSQAKDEDGTEDEGGEPELPNGEVRVAEAMESATSKTAAATKGKAPLRTVQARKLKPARR